jgi:hypothetical protein
MIDRRVLQCISCGTRFLTRTGIGNGTIQKHKFACPTCRIEIGFVLNVNQETPDLRYEEPANAHFILPIILSRSIFSASFTRWNHTGG